VFFWVFVLFFRAYLNIAAFAMDKYPVTNDQFAFFLGDSGYTPMEKTNFLRDWIPGLFLVRTFFFVVAFSV
jgi:formylglycine-generating enzyme required for sulfatase activity